jgi:hypothetical protein
MGSQSLSGPCQDSSNFTTTDKKGGFLGFGAQKANAFKNDAVGTPATDSAASSYAAQTNQKSGNEQVSRIDSHTDANGSQTATTSPIHTDSATPTSASFKPDVTPSSVAV